MACRFTAQLWRSLASDNKSQSLHTNASISVEGGFKQALEADARHYRTCCSSLHLRSWSGKPMHGQYRCLSEQPPVDMKEAYGWLKAANLPAATEGLVVAAQDQAFRTQYYEHKIIHRDVSPTCRIRSVGLKTVDHIVAGCSTWHRWSTLIDTIRWPPSFTGMFVAVLGVPVESRWYQHHPDRLVETDDITMMWDTTIPTATKIKANHPHICLRK